MTKYLLPLGGFFLLVIFLFIGLGLKPRELHSPLLNKPAPNFQLASLEDPARIVSSKELLGKVWVLNVWASWCTSCRQEHPLLTELADSKLVPIYGLNYKDKRDDAIAWLQQAGNPYQLSASDTDGRTGIEYGVYGVPETYVIDRSGVIRYKQVGPITAQSLQEHILPVIKRLTQ